MPEEDGKKERVDKNRRDFLGKSGTALAAVGMAHVAGGSALGQQAAGSAQSQQAAVSPIVRQTELQDYMLKADSAMSRIGKGIYGGLLDEVAAGAEDLEKALRAIEQVNIGEAGERQAAWKKRSVEAADNAKKLRGLAATARQKGEKEIAAEILQVYSAAMATTIACHSTFRRRA